MKRSFDFKAVLTHARNQNFALRDALLIGAAYKPHNLGFMYKLFFMLSDSKVGAIEIYREAFSQKITQVSFIFLDFETNFASVAPLGTQVEKIIAAATKKANINLEKV